jgi:hypothetical protein
VQAYFLGWIALDGSFQKSGTIRITLQPGDVGILEQLHDGICPELPITTTKKGYVQLNICSIVMNTNSRQWLGLEHFTKDELWKKSHCMLSESWQKQLPKSQHCIEFSHHVGSHLSICWSSCMYFWSQPQMGECCISTHAFTHVPKCQPQAQQEVFALSMAAVMAAEID